MELGISRGSSLVVPVFVAESLGHQPFVRKGSTCWWRCWTFGLQYWCPPAGVSWQSGTVRKGFTCWWHYLILGPQYWHPPAGVSRQCGADIISCNQASPEPDCRRCVLIPGKHTHLAWYHPCALTWTRDPGTWPCLCTWYLCPVPEPVPPVTLLPLPLPCSLIRPSSPCPVCSLPHLLIYRWWPWPGYVYDSGIPHLLYIPVWLLLFVGLCLVVGLLCTVLYWRCLYLYFTYFNKLLYFHFTCVWFPLLLSTQFWLHLIHDIFPDMDSYFPWACDGIR